MDVKRRHVNCGTYFLFWVAKNRGTGMDSILSCVMSCHVMSCHVISCQVKKQQPQQQQFLIYVFFFFIQNVSI